MTYTQQGDRVTLEMTRDDYNRLTIMLGTALRIAFEDADKRRFWSWVRFANELNFNNPKWTPFEVPAEYAGSKP